MHRSGRTWALVLLPIMIGCGPKALTPEKARELLAKDPSFAGAVPELLLADELTICPLFRSYNGRPFPVGTACDEITSIAGTSGGRIAVTLPRKLPRRVVEVKSVEPGKAETAAVVSWEWVPDSLGTELASCFDLSPRESMAMFEVREREWAVKEVISEKLGVISAKCGGR
jgi:hypothetical protein